MLRNDIVLLVIRTSLRRRRVHTKKYEILKLMVFNNLLTFVPYVEISYILLERHDPPHITYFAYIRLCAYYLASGARHYFTQGRNYISLPFK